MYFYYHIVVNSGKHHYLRPLSRRFAARVEQYTWRVEATVQCAALQNRYLQVKRLRSPLASDVLTLAIVPLNSSFSGDKNSLFGWNDTVGKGSRKLA
jgi:hypothetical protein